MAKIPHLPIRRVPTYEIYARFAPGTFDAINAIRKKYAPKQIYPRDIGIRLFRDIFKTTKSTNALQNSLATLAKSVAPFHAEIVKPFRNMAAETREYPPSVYYEISRSPFNLLCVDLRISFNRLSGRRDRPQITKSFKIGLTGELENYEESDRIVNDLKSIELPKPLLFDAFVLATRPNTKVLSELEEETQEFPFTATEDEFKIFIDKTTVIRDKYLKKREAEKIAKKNKEKENKEPSNSSGVESATGVTEVLEGGEDKETQATTKAPENI